MNPHYHYNTPDVYLSFHCQEEVERLFAKLKSERPLDYENNGIQAFTIRYGEDHEFVTVLHDTRDEKDMLNVDLKKIKKEPEPVSAFMLKRGTFEASSYHLLSSRRTYESLIAGARAIDPEIGEDMLDYLQGAFSEERDLIKKAALIEKMGPIVRDWAIVHRQHLVYNGQDHSDERWKLRKFIASYLNTVIMDDKLMLVHSGSAKTFALQMRENGYAWHCADSNYGIEKEQAQGNLSAEIFDDLFDQNAYEHYFLKHIFERENCIALTYEGKLVALSDQVEELHLYLKSILEDVMCIPEIESLSDNFDEQVDLFGALMAQKLSACQDGTLPPASYTDVVAP